MKPSLTNRQSIMFVLLAFFVWILVMSGCRCCTSHTTSWREYIQPDSPGTRPAADPKNQLIVWRKPGYTNDDSFNQWLDKLKQGGSVGINYFCSSCDSSLMMLTGPGVTSYISGQTATGGKGSGGSGISGDDGPLYYAANFPVSYPPAYLSRLISYDSLKSSDSIGYRAVVGNACEFRGPAVKVAVFDTGIDSSQIIMHPFPLYHAPFGGGCIGGALLGWNFVSWTSNITDDNAERHGTTVTTFALDQVSMYCGDSIQFLAIKTHARDGSGDLFGVLCGFAYAAKMKVNIVNASFGYYTPRDSPFVNQIDTSATLLGAYVEHYLKRNNILLVAAAGNMDPNERAILASYNKKYNNVPDSVLRNLDSVSFYPACLARDSKFANVLAVTTVFGSKSVSPHQNFSSGVVDVGVNADRVQQDSLYLFNNPILRFAGSGVRVKTVEGSSFATPIVTGKICTHFYLYKNLFDSGPLNKWKILEILRSQGAVKPAPPASPLYQKISNGNCMNK